MCEQCVSGSLSPPPREPGHEAKLFWTAKKLRCYIADNRAALDCEYVSADRPKYHLLNGCLSMAPPTFVRTVRAYKVPLVTEVDGGQ